MDIKHVNDVEPLGMDALQLCAERVIDEVLRQDDLARNGAFGDTHILPSGPNHARLGVLVEEVGEVARELNEGIIADGVNVQRLRAELVQTAASALAWVTALDEGRQ